MYAYFTFAEVRRIRKVLCIMKVLAENDDFFATALEEFESADTQEKIPMCNYLLKIFNDARESECMSLEQAVVLSAYPA